MANIPITQTQVDVYPNSALHPELASKRDDVTGLIQGNFQVSNNVHGEGTKFISGASEFGEAAPAFKFIRSEIENSSATVSSDYIETGDLVFAFCLYYSNVTPGVESGFTNITGGRYSSYHGWRYMYKVATSTDATNGITVNNGNYANVIAVFRPLSTPSYTGGVFVNYNNQYSSYYTPTTTTGSVLIYTMGTVNDQSVVVGPDPDEGFLSSNGIAGYTQGGNEGYFAYKLLPAGAVAADNTHRAYIAGSGFRHGAILQFNL